MVHLVMTRGDKALLALLLLGSAILISSLYRGIFHNRQQDTVKEAIIYADGAVVMRTPLDPGGASTSFTVNGKLGPSTVAVENGRIRMLQAPCPGHLCVRQGWIDLPGQSVVCVPGKLVIRVSGKAPIDAVTR